MMTDINGAAAAEPENPPAKFRYLLITSAGLCKGTNSAEVAGLHCLHNRGQGLAFDTVEGHQLFMVPKNNKLQATPVEPI